MAGWGKKIKKRNEDISQTKGNREGHNSKRIFLCHCDAAKSATDVILFRLSEELRFFGATSLH